MINLSLATAVKIINWDKPNSTCYTRLSPGEDFTFILSCFDQQMKITEEDLSKLLLQDTENIWKIG